MTPEAATKPETAVAIERTEWRVRDLVARIRSEYAEMPGLCLTQTQAERLWGLDSLMCEHVLAALIQAGYLRPTPRGYIRA
jgi:hypothetical protein